MKTNDALRGRMSDAYRSQYNPRTPALSPGQRFPKTTRPNKLWLTTPGLALVLAAWVQVAQAQSTNFNYTGGFQTWTVPATGLYQITAFGAQGGGSAGYGIGGFGAEIGGEFSLTNGQVLTIAVGGQGGGPISYIAFGGGGGSFVVSIAPGATNALVIAGGGGGASKVANGGSGLTSANGGNGGAGGGLGGSSGGGGAGGSPEFSGAGGGGVLNNGGNGSNGGGGGFGFPAGLAGGVGYGGSGNGGFGGGGGGSFQSSTAGGGGGGYSGGGGGSSSGGGGGGGGSFNGGSNQVNVAGFQAGNGLVEIVQDFPVLNITNGAPGFVVLSWSPASTNWVLQENLDLTTTNWVNSPSGITNPVTVLATGSAKFYRISLQE